MAGPGDVGAQDGRDTGPAAHGAALVVAGPLREAGADDARRVRIALISHTNAGKTTLARTLLAADVGEVRDAPHVTEFSTQHVLLRTDDGAELELWDTPGFGDSARLAKRMRQQGNPLGWFLSQVWDRWRDRPFWASQRALKTARDETDVVLYLVNASESPQAAAYVPAEMDLLGWIGHPVIVLLNQLGAPRPAAEEAGEIERWRVHLADRPQVRRVMPMDAFARCWVQEGLLLHAIEDVLPAGKATAMRALRAQWERARLQTFDAAVDEMAGGIARIAVQRVALPESGSITDRVRRVAGSIGALISGKEADSDEIVRRAQGELTRQLQDEVRDGTSRLGALHGLAGQAQTKILERVAANYEVRERIGEGRAAMVGGMLTGALAGLKADIATGGLTLGGGLLTGGLLGALGGAGVARGINEARGGGPSWVGWRPEAMDPIVQATLLRYLAVAHFGRGRGQWAEGEAPAHWRDVVVQALAPVQDRLDALWAERAKTYDNAGDLERLQAQLPPLVRQAARGALERLYPGTWPDEGAAVASAASDVASRDATSPAAPDVD